MTVFPSGYSRVLGAEAQAVSRADLPHHPLVHRLTDLDVVEMLLGLGIILGLLVLLLGLMPWNGWAAVLWSVPPSALALVGLRAGWRWLIRSRGKLE